MALADRQFFSDDQRAAATAVLARATCCCSSPTERVAAPALGALRLHLADASASCPKVAMTRWIVEFPMFERTDAGAWTPLHHHSAPRARSTTPAR